MRYIEFIRQFIRRIMRLVARFLNTITGGKLHPDMVTIVGVAMHIVIAWLIALRHFNVLAAILLLIFGLFDTLDGELARLQHRASPHGMLLDASTDRMKEVFLYTGIAYAFAIGNHPATAAWATGACGASLCVSYIKAKGEAAFASQEKTHHHELNMMFKDGLLTFELRMTLLIFGLLFNLLVPATVAITILATYTALQRLLRIGRMI